MNALLDAALLSELRRVELRTRRSIDTDLMGRYRSAFRGSGLIFSDLREYQPGDDVKHIHWKASARSNRVYVKSYEEDRQLTVLLALDVSNSTRFGSDKSKYRRELEFAALLTMLASSTQDAVGLLLFGGKVHDFLPANKKRSQVQRILMELLRERSLEQATDMRPMLEHLRQHQRRPAVIFIVSDFFCPPFEEELRVLALRHDVVLVLVEDRLDADLPQAGIVEFYDAESGQRVLLDTSHKGTREALGTLHERRVQRLSEMAQKVGADLIRIDENPLAPLATLMEQRAKRFR